MTSAKSKSAKEETKLPLSILLFAPVLLWSVLAYGAPGGTTRNIAVLLTAVCSLQILIFSKGKFFPKQALPATISLGFLLLYGGLMVANARSYHSLNPWFFEETSWRLFGGDWGSLARMASLRSCLELLSVSFAFLAVLKLTQRKEWPKLIGLLSLIALMVVIIGMVHIVLGIRAVWSPVVGDDGHFFAPYIYHANAAAFLNLIFPLSVGICLGLVGNRRKRSQCYFWGLCSLVIASGIAATASKGGIVILALSILVQAIFHRHAIKRFIKGFLTSDKESKIEKSLFVLFLSLIGVALFCVSYQGIKKNVSYFSKQAVEGKAVNFEKRVAVQKILRGMIETPEIGRYGLGPGTFRHTFPYYIGEEGFAANLHENEWYQAHSDPLQTLVEWGYLGAGAWFLIGIGGVTRGVFLLRSSQLSGRKRSLVRGLMIGLCTVGVHSAFDFPLSIYSIHLVAVMMCGMLWGIPLRRGRSQ